jgi:uncharacterized protein YggE
MLEGVYRKELHMRVRTLLIAAVAALMPVSGMALEATRQIIVDGDGHVSAVPDMAIVQFGVSREAPEAGAAMRSASEAMAAVLNSIGAAGIARDDVRTTRIGLDPQWSYSQDGTSPRLTGYVASNDLSVTVRDLDGLGDLLDAVVAEGVNTMTGLSFAVADPTELEDTARAAAVEDAVRKAGTLAWASGVNLGEVISISESAGGIAPMPRFEAAMADRAAVPVAAGQVEISVTVTAVFAIAE